MPNFRLKLVDSLRGVAAVGVALYHFNVVVPFEPSIYQSAVTFGWLGVVIFFVVSGFSIQLSTKRVSSVTEYLRHRFWRIYPPYLASVAIIVVLIGARKLTFGTNDFIAVPSTILGWLATVTLTTTPVTDIPAINWVYWSLSYEIAFYFLIGVAVLWRSTLWPLLFTMTFAAVAIGQAPQALFFLNWWSLFALGAALAEWTSSSKRLLPIALTALCVSDLVINREIAPAITGIATFLLVGACLSPAGTSLNREPVFSRIGTVSYGLYLLHVPIGGWLLLRVLDPLRHINVAIHIGIDLAVLCASICAATIFFSRDRTARNGDGPRKAQQA